MALDLNTMHLTFDDEFNSLSLYNGVSGTWNPTYGYSSDLNNFASHVHGEEKQIYVDPAFTGTTSGALGANPFSIQDGILNITAAPTSPALADALGGYQYTSGLITTQQTFQQTYGYFEMSARLPDGQGLWPAFWLLPAGGWGPPEIDVVEMLGNNPSTIYTTAHSTVTGQLQSTSFASNVADTSAGFHTYGVDWEPDQITWYFDGQQIAQTATPADMHSPMYMLANLAVGGNWPGSPDATTAFPANMQIDYIRAYASGPAQSGTAVMPEANQPTSTGGTTAATASATPDTNPASGSGTAPTGSGSTAGATATSDTNLASESHAASASSGAATTSEANAADLAAIAPLVEQFLGSNGGMGAGDGDGGVAGGGAGGGGASGAGDGKAAPAFSDLALSFNEVTHAFEGGLWHNVVEKAGHGLGSMGHYMTDLQNVRAGLQAEVAAGQLTGDAPTHVNTMLADTTTALSTTTASVKGDGKLGSVAASEAASHNAHSDIPNVVDNDANLAGVATQNGTAKFLTTPGINPADTPHANLAEIRTIFDDLANISLGGFNADNSARATADVNAIITGMQDLMTANPVLLGNLTGVHAGAGAGTGSGAGVGGCSHNGQGDHGGSDSTDIAALLQAMQGGNHAAINGAVTAFNDVHNAEAAEVRNGTAALNNHHHFEVFWHH